MHLGNQVGLNQKVLGLNPAGGRIQLMIVLYCTELFITILSTSQYDLINVEMDVKCQIIGSQRFDIFLISAQYIHYG